MREFQLAAERDQQEKELGEETVLEFALGEETFRAKLATPGQSSLVIGAFGQNETQAIQAVYKFLRRILLDDGYRRLTRMVEEDKVSFGVLFGGDDNNDGGIVDWIIEESASRPTRPSTESSSSPTTGGRKSTGALAGSGIDPFGLNLRQFVNYVYTWALNRVSSEDVQRWIEDMNDPYWGDKRAIDNVPQRVVDDELAAFGKAFGS
ncbi:tail assembly chaperone [Microbacterium phage Kelcole]|nr:tail assembly chaperone [Microbacterium phage Kelcole]